MALFKEEKEAIINEYSQEDIKNTGDSRVQVTIFTKEIILLTEHLKKHKKDYATRRRLLQYVGKRNKLLNYLFRKNKNEYYKLIEKLEIRDKNKIS